MITNESISTPKQKNILFNLSLITKKMEGIDLCCLYGRYKENIDCTNMETQLFM